MAIITKTGTPSKGSSTTFTLNKVELASLVSTLESPSDIYYSSSSNWKTVFVVYKSSIGNQSEILKFDASQSTPSADFSVSSTARDLFEVSKIIIHDFDGGVFDIPRAELITSDFDVDFSSPAGPTYIIYDLYDNSGALPILGPVGDVSGGDSNNYELIKSSNFFPAGMSFSLEFQFDWSSSPISGGIFLGISQFADYLDYNFPDLAMDQACGILQTANDAGIVSAQVYLNGNVVAFIGGPFSSNPAIVIQTAGSNTFKIEFDGSNVTQSLNGVMVAFGSSALYNAYPTVRTVGAVACSSSYKY